MRGTTITATSDLVMDAEVDAFHRDGAIVLRDLFGDWIEVLRRGIERNIAEPSADAHIYDDDKGARFFGDYCSWARIPEYRAFAFDSPAGMVAARLMASCTARLFHEHVLVKEPGVDIPTPWHHDQPYYCVDGAQNVSLWLALDEVPADTCVRFVTGSHRWGRWFRPERFNKSPLNPDDGLESVPDIDGDPGTYRILAWDMAPGDAIAFNFLTLHGAPPNRSLERRRRAFSTRWVGDDATFTRRDAVTSPPFRDVTLGPGDPLDAPEFPLVYPRAS